MDELLEMGNDPQEGLKGLVKACLDGCRYSYEIIPLLSDTVKKMIQKGASINEDILKMITMPNYFNPKYFEDDMGRLITAKAFLLKMFLKEMENEVKPVLLDIIPTWDQIEPTYWEDMVITDPENRYALILDAQYNYLDAFHKALISEMRYDEHYDDDDEDDERLLEI
jgi:hypothetical protein